MLQGEMNKIRLLYELNYKEISRITSRAPRQQRQLITRFKLSQIVDKSGYTMKIPIHSL